MLNTVAKFNHTDFPFGTFAVNILGGFVMGLWIATMAFTTPIHGKELHLLFAVGVLGGFTTFSAFSVDAYLLLERGEFLLAGAYMIGSVVVSILALFFGMWLIRLAF